MMVVFLLTVAAQGRELYPEEVPMRPDASAAADSHFADYPMLNVTGAP